MSERQVQYTDGSWSREVEVTDDAVEAATRLLSGDLLYTEENIDRTLRDLIERVQQAEQEAETQAGIAAIRTAERDDVARDGRLRLAAAERERDAARGKLDKVREAAEDTSESVSNDWGWGYDAAMERVLAILDGKTGD